MGYKQMISKSSCILLCCIIYAIQSFHTEIRSLHNVCNRVDYLSLKLRTSDEDTSSGSDIGMSRSGVDKFQVITPRDLSRLFPTVPKEAPPQETTASKGLKTDLFNDDWQDEIEEEEEYDQDQDRYDQVTEAIPVMEQVVDIPEYQQVFVPVPENTKGDATTYLEVQLDTLNNIFGVEMGDKWLPELSNAIKIGSRKNMKEEVKEEDVDDLSDEAFYRDIGFDYVLMNKTMDTVSILTSYYLSS